MRRFVVLLLVVAAGLVAAGLGVSSTAATVNGSAISQSSLNADLGAIAASQSYQCYLAVQRELSSGAGSAAAILPVTGVGNSGVSGANGTYNTGFVRYWLSQKMENMLVDQLLARRGVSLTSTDRAVGRATLPLQISGTLTQYQSQTGSAVCAASGTAVLASLPGWFVDEQSTVQAAQDALLASVAGFGLDAASLERYYGRHPSQFDTICLKVIQETTQAAAQQALAAIKAGTPFARAGTVTQNGCTVVAGSSLPASITTLPAGGVSPALAQSSGSYVIVQVTKHAGTPFAQVQSVVRDAVMAAGQSGTAVLLRSATTHSTSSADPRYGRTLPRTILLVPVKAVPPGAMLAPVLNVPTIPPPSSSGSASVAPAGGSASAGGSAAGGSAATGGISSSG